MDALQELPKKIDDTYDDALARIKSQPEEDQGLGIKILMWIITALRPLTLLELQDALAVKPGDDSFNRDGITDEKTLLAVCGGLVTLDGVSQTVRLIRAYAI